MKKSLLTRVLLLVMIVACLMAVTSCKLFNKLHKHSYNQSTVAPTCTEPGKTVYTCSCGDSYSEDNGNAALGHDMKSKKGNPPTCIAEGFGDYEECTRCGHNTKVAEPATGHYYSITDITYPTLTESGSRTMKCVACNDSFTTVISATGISLPSGSDLIYAIVGELSFHAELDENSYIANSTETSNLVVENGSKYFTRFSVGEVDFTSNNGSIEGYAKVVFHTADVVLDGSVDPDSVTPGAYDDTISIYVYVNDNYISFEAVSNTGESMSEEIDLTKAVYTILLSRFGVGEEEFDKTLYALVQFGEVSDDILKIYGAFANMPGFETTDEYNAALEAIAALVSSEILVATKDANGNTTYKTNLAVLEEYVDLIDGKTVSQFIDFTYGEGAAENLRSFAVNIPYMTLKEIANFAIEYAENYGADVDAVFSFVDLLIYASTGESVNVKYLIDTSLDMTIAEVMVAADGEGMDANALAEEISSSIATVIDTLYPFNFDQLYNFAVYGNPDYVDAYGEKFSIIETLRYICQEIDKVAYFEMTVDAEGYVTYIGLVYADLIASLNIDGDNLSLEVKYLDEFNVTLNVTSSSIDFNVTTNGSTVISGSYGVVEENGQLVYHVDFFSGETQLLFFDAVVGDGELVSYDLRIDTINSVGTDVFDEDGYYLYTTYEKVVETALTVNFSTVYDCKIWKIVSDESELIIEIREIDGKVKYNFYALTDDELDATGEVVYEEIDEDSFKLDGIFNDGRFDVLKFSYEVCDGILVYSYSEIPTIAKDGEYVYSDDDPYGYPVWVEGEPYISRTTITEYKYEDEKMYYSITNIDKDGVCVGAYEITKESVGNVHIFSITIPKTLTSNSGMLGDPDSGVTYFNYTEGYIGFIIEIR